MRDPPTPEATVSRILEDRFHPEEPVDFLLGLFDREMGLKEEVFLDVRAQDSDREIMDLVLEGKEDLLRLGEVILDRDIGEVLGRQEENLFGVEAMMADAKNLYNKKSLHCSDFLLYRNGQGFFADISGFVGEENTIKMVELMLEDAG